MDPDNRVALAEIRGDIKLVLVGQERTHNDVLNVNKRLDAHDSRIRSLETDRSNRDGERKGVTIGGHIIGWLIGLLVGSGGVIALLEAFK